MTNCGNMVAEDGMYSYIVNFSNQRDKTDNRELEDLVSYFRNREVNSAMTEKIDDIVTDLNERPVWRDNVMTIEELLEMVKINERIKLKGKLLRQLLTKRELLCSK